MADLDSGIAAPGERRLPRASRSLGRRLHKRVLVLALVAILGVFAAMVISLYSTLDRLERQFREAGMRATGAFDSYLLEVRSDLVASADALSRSSDRNALLRQLIARRPTLFELLLVDIDGTVLVQRNRVGRPNLTAFAHQPWLEDARQGRPYIGPVTFGDFSVPTVDLAAPVRNELGVFSTTLVARFDLTSLWNRAISLQVGDSGYVYIADRDGLLVAHRNLRLLHSRTLIQNEIGLAAETIVDGGLHFYRSLYGDLVVGFGMSLEQVPWVAIVEQPVREALGPALLQTALLLLALLLAAMLVRSILGFTRRHMLEPLASLHTGVERLKAGDLDARTRLPEGHGELSGLSHTFDQMADQLQAREQELRRSLAETTELKNLLDNVFRSIVSGVVTADLDGQISLCNHAAVRILGYRDAQALVGLRLGQLMPPLNLLLPSRMETIRRSQQPLVGLEVSPTLPERGRLHWRLSLSALRGADQVLGIAIVIDDVTEMRQMEAQRRLLEHMVSPAILGQIDPERLQLGGQRKTISILFADIHGFTAISEQLTPEALVELLNRYLGAMADAVLAEQGTIDKFLGDAVMAWFNAPLPQPDHTLRAVRTALRIREAFSVLHAQLAPQQRLSFGVGIHVGEAVLGLIGTEERIEYTAIGDDVNTAKRLQEHSGTDQILLSYSAWEQVRDQVEVAPLDPIKVKGKHRRLEVFEVLHLKG